MLRADNVTYVHGRAGRHGGRATPASSSEDRSVSAVAQGFSPAKTSVGVKTSPGEVSANAAGNRSGRGFQALPGVQDVSVRVERGDVVGILGPNGSGKTTLLRLLAGMLRPESGTVSIDGESIATMARSNLARRVAVVPQETHLALD
ncbi:MAG: ATP-binding cassette domain-containing protein [Acidobacteria bacterium]|nr:ATP-binding cassette domain-containing protein [Acidobacteriota bacterium]